METKSHFSHEHDEISVQKHYVKLLIAVNYDYGAETVKTDVRKQFVGH